MRTDSFYSKLKSFSQFNEIAHDRHFLPVPEDWSIVTTDVNGSTIAINEGRYKDVNTLGAASIAAAYHAMEGEDFPFDFAGDGATRSLHRRRQRRLCESGRSAQKPNEETRHVMACKIWKIMVSWFCSYPWEDRRRAANPARRTPQRHRRWPTMSRSYPWWHAPFTISKM